MERMKITMYPLLFLNDASSHNVMYCWKNKNKGKYTNTMEVNNQYSQLYTYYNKHYDRLFI